MGGRFDGTGQAAKREVDEAGAPTWEDACRELATGSLMASTPQVVWWATRGLGSPAAHGLSTNRGAGRLGDRPHSARWQRPTWSKDLDLTLGSKLSVAKCSMSNPLDRDLERQQRSGGDRLEGEPWRFPRLQLVHPDVESYLQSLSRLFRQPACPQ